MSNHNTTAILPHQKKILGHPVGLYILFFTELWERFSYYGMRGLLVLYVSGPISGEFPGLGWSTKEAFQLYGWYTMFIYLLSIVGGILADKLLGQKKTVFLGGVLLVIGHGVLAIPNPTSFFIGLILIILGVGSLKPNISSMVGSLYPKGDPKRDKGFVIFYMGINIGAFLSGIIVGIVSYKYGWHAGFGLAAIGMIIGLICYMWGSKYLIHVGNFIGNASHESNNQIHQKLSKVEKDRIIVLLISFLIVIIFWGAFEQAGGLMNVYTDYKIDRQTGLQTNIDWIKEIPTVVFQSLNSGYIIIFGAVISSFWIWMKRRNKETSSVFKMSIGTIIMGLGFVFMYFASSEASEVPFGKASMVWIFMAYLFHTIGELCCSPVAMSFITKLAPVKYVSIIMGIYFATTGIGNKLAGILGEYSQLTPISAQLTIDKTNDNTLDIENNLVLYSDVFLKDNKTKFIVDNQDISQFISLNSKEKGKLNKQINQLELPSEDDVLHARLRLEKTDVADNYNVSFVIEELQNKKESQTFLFITIFCVGFGGLILLFLKKMKKLAHGAED